MNKWRTQLTVLRFEHHDRECYTLIQSMIHSNMWYHQSTTTTYLPTQERGVSPSTVPNLPMRTLHWSILVLESWGEIIEIRIVVVKKRGGVDACLLLLRSLFQSSSSSSFHIICVLSNLSLDHYYPERWRCDDDVTINFVYLILLWLSTKTIHLVVVVVDHIIANTRFSQQHGECWAQHQRKSGTSLSSHSSFGCRQLLPSHTRMKYYFAHTTISYLSISDHYCLSSRTSVHTTQQLIYIYIYIYL